MSFKDAFKGKTEPHVDTEAQADARAKAAAEVKAKGDAKVARDAAQAQKSSPNQGKVAPPVQDPSAGRPRT